MDRKPGPRRSRGFTLVEILLGIAVISFAIMLLAASARTEDKLDPRGLMFTLAAGVFTAIVVVVDSIGVRLSGNTLGYAAVAAIVNAVTLPILLAFEGVHPRQLLKGNKRFGMMGASVSMVSYLLILLAYQNGPVAPSSAIRETSVVFATAFAALLLGETIGRLRWLAVGLTCVGMVIIRLV
jgi:prepilin-type N-terminal cleavage/methylation domain-containing protein